MNCLCESVAPMALNDDAQPVRPSSSRPLVTCACVIAVAVLLISGKSAGSVWDLTGGDSPGMRRP